jgi:hypothetical protein
MDAVEYILMALINKVRIVRFTVHVSYYIYFRCLGNSREPLFQNRVLVSVAAVGVSFNILLSNHSVSPTDHQLCDQLNTRTDEQPL